MAAYTKPQRRPPRTALALRAALAVTLVALPGVSYAQSQAEMTSFLTSAAGRLAQDQVVSAACRSTAGLQRYAQTVQQIGGQLGTAQQLASVLRGKGGLPVSDLMATAAAGGVKDAAKQAAMVDNHALTFSLASLCNTAETARLQRAAFTYLRSVVNRGIGNVLPTLDFSSKVTSVVDASVRQDRYDRLFARGSSQRAQRAVTPEMALVDSSAAEAYASADRGDSLADHAMRQLRDLYAQLYQAPDPDGYCRTVSEAGDSVRFQPTRRNPITNVGFTCGPVSPGRARQLMPAIASVQAMLQAGQARTQRAAMDMETAVLSQKIKDERAQT